MKMKKLVRVCLFASVVALFGPGWAQAGFSTSILHSFSGGAGDGAHPYGSLTLSGTNLYGATQAGGAIGIGMLFKLNVDGSGYTTLHNFTGGASDGSEPFGSLTLSGTNLYGTSEYGGVSNKGVVFKLNVDGSGYTNLHSFTGGANDGDDTLGSLALSGSYLYGMTDNGGASNRGVIFMMNVNGSGYTNLHSFAGGTNDGAYPYGSLLLTGTNLYGMAMQSGGFGGEGTLFKLNVDGSGYTNLHVFGSGATNGVYPWGDVILSGSTLYGMTVQGGASGTGVVFKMNVNGSGYTNLHSFAGGAGDGANPYGSLILSGTALYGMAKSGGAHNTGVVFRINVDGSGYANVHNFAGGASDGATPWGSLTQSGSTLYGMTVNGGASGNGVVFSLTQSGTWDSGYQDLGGGWRRLTWLGDYQDAGGGWIWHGEHGWLYPVGTSPSSVWFWSSRLAWLWTSDGVYSFFWHNAGGVWLYYYRGSGNGSGGWYYNYGTAQNEWH